MKQIERVDELDVVGAVVNLSVRQIVRNPDQPRKRFQEGKLLELGESMKESGQKDPCRVFSVGNRVYMLEEGERRWRAAQKVGLTHLRCVIVPQPDERELLENSLISGVQRENLSPMEEAAAYHKLNTAFSLSIWQISQRVGRSDGHVRGRIIWMDERVPAEVREMIDDGDFPKSKEVAEALFTLPDNETRLRLALRLRGKSAKAIMTACQKFVDLQAETERQAQVAAIVSVPKPAANGHQPTAPTSAAVRLAVNGSQPPVTIPLAMARTAAHQMCAGCELKGDLLEKLPEPAWYLVAQSAAEVCNRCGLSQRDLSFCKRCPAVDLLRRVVKGAK